MIEFVMVGLAGIGLGTLVWFFWRLYMALTLVRRLKGLP
jgi:hypothetical protein